MPGPSLVEQHTLAIRQGAQDMRIICVATACICRRFSFHTIAKLKIRELIQVTVSIQPQIERRRSKATLRIDGSRGGW